LETNEELMDHIYSRCRLCLRLRLRRSGYCFRGLILRLTRHFRLLLSRTYITPRIYITPHTALQYSNPPL